MPKRHDIPGFRFESDTPPPSYNDIVNNGADYFCRPFHSDENLNFVHDNGDTGSVNNFASGVDQLAMERDRTESDRSTPTGSANRVSEGDDVPDTFTYHLTDIGHIMPSGESTDSNGNENRGRRSPLLRQPAYDYSTRRPSEVRRCMSLLKILSQDDDLDNDLEVDGEVVLGDQDTAGGLDDVDGGCGFDDVDGCADAGCTNLISFIKKCPEGSQSMIASYLSSGKISDIVLCPENFHLFLHVSISLNLRQLKEHCIKHYFECNEADKLMINGDCTCVFAIEYECVKGYQRSESIISDHGDNSPPEYYIAFTRSRKTPNKAHVVVLNLANRQKVLQRVIEKPFGNGFACCSIERNESPFIYVSGGENKSQTQVWKYDVIEGRWNKSTKLAHGRSFHAMTVCNGTLYVLGGKEVPCIEEYDHSGKKWKDRASLIIPVHSAICAVHGRKIYIFGGQTPAGPVSTVQCFDTVTNRVSRLPDLPCTISNGQAVVLNDHIYIASGQGHLIMFEALCGISKLCSEQPVRREQFGMFVKNDRIYLVGGDVCESEGSDDKPEYRYNPEKDCWVEKDTSNICLPVYASCIIRFPKKCPVIPFDYS